MMDHSKLASISLASYYSANRVGEVMYGATGDTHTFGNDKTGTVGYVSINHNSKEAVVVFRGTEDLKDILTDIRFFKVETLFGRKIHGGFLKAYSSISLDLSRLVDLIPLGYATYFTGHSLGGALALIHTLLSGKKPTLTVTFGSPRIGGGKVAKDLGEYACVKYVNGWDIVARIPIINYYDGAEIRYVCKRGSGVLVNPSAWDMLKDRLGTWGLFSDHKMANYIEKFKPQ